MVSNFCCSITFKGEACSVTAFFFPTVDDVSLTNMPRGFEASPEARAQADLKFTYVVSCQIYGQQKQQKKPEATDIALLLQRYAFFFPPIIYIYNFVGYNHSFCHKVQYLIGMAK